MKKLSSPFALIKKSVEIFEKRENLIFLMEVYLPVAFFSLLSVAQDYLPASIKNSNSVWLSIGTGVLQLIYLLVGVFVTASAITALGKVVEGGELSLRKTFRAGWKKYWIFLLLSIVITALYLLGFVLLIVPGVLFVVWFAFSKFIAIETGSGIKESLLKSKTLVKGIYWKTLGRLIIFGLFAVVIDVVLSVIPYGLGTIISSLLGGLFMLPTYLLYKEISG
ncbi:MAG: hypothetical protein ABSE04_01945 [Candidatus Microgenomates bacterium]|jgi:hypothetical protein